MRYIRQIVSIMILLTAFSCKKSPQPDMPLQEKIEFLPMIGTRSFITGPEDTGFKEGFAVFAKKTERPDSGIPSDSPDAGMSKEIMNNVKVSNDNGQWTYSPEVWWGFNCDHEFLAVYPYKANTTDYIFGKDETYHRSLVNTLSPQGKPIGEDIMYARHQEYYNLGMTPRPIALNFSHALTAVSFKIRNVSTKKITSIEDVSLAGLYTRATDLAIPRDASKAPTMVLDVPIAEGPGGQPVPGSVGTYLFENYTTAIPTDDQNWRILTGPDIILPQSLLNKTVEFKFTVKFEASPQQTYTYKLEKIALQNEIETKYDYLPGKHYIYRIDILDKDIKFSVYVKDWTESDIIELK